MLVERLNLNLVQILDRIIHFDNHRATNVFFVAVI